MLHMSELTILAKITLSFNYMWFAGPVSSGKGGTFYWAK